MEKLHYSSDANEISMKSKAGHLRVTKTFFRTPGHFSWKGMDGTNSLLVRTQQV